MERRQFLVASLAASVAAGSHNAAAQAPASHNREYYLLRRYNLQNGPQIRQTESYFTGALIPALTRMSLGPIGAFRLEFGVETPAFYLLVPGANLASLAQLDFHLAADPEFMASASAYWNATAATPPFQRVTTSLLAAFEGWPKLTPPAKEKRIFQMRTYESASDGGHVRKVEMFNAGEFDIFVKAGFHDVFFGDTLIGDRMPCLTYMLSCPDKAQMDANWDRFRNDPAWKKLSTDPRYASDELVVNITNQILTPLDCSQI